LAQAAAQWLSAASPICCRAACDGGGDTSNSSMAKSASSSRLRKTWENVRDRQARDEDRFTWKPPSLSKGASTLDVHHHGDGHGHGHHHHHHGHGGMHHGASAPDLLPLMNVEDDNEEGALVVLEQRRKYRAAHKGLRKKISDLEDNMFDSRRPPLLRTVGGEVVQGVYPPRSHKWLGVQPRFGTVVPQQKYVGAFASDLSKWISADKVTRLKQEASIMDQPVRAYIKIDDSIDINRMTGSHMKFIDNPLDEELQEKKRLAREKQQQLLWEQQFALEAADGGSDQPYESYASEQPGSGEYSDEEYYEEEGEEEESEYSEDEEEDASESASGSGSGSGSGASSRRLQRREKEAKSMAVLDEIFQRHCTKLSQGIQGKVQSKLKQLEGEWSKGQATRPATLRFRR